MPVSLPGRSFPIGAHITRGGVELSGVNFSIYSRGSTAMELLLFDHPQDAQPAHVLPFIPGSTARTITGICLSRI